MKPVNALLIAVLLLPAFTLATTVSCTNSYQGSKTLTYTLPQGTENPGENQMRVIGPKQGADISRQDLGRTFYTPELTVFPNEKTCSLGPCDQNTLGLAHRSWPLGSCVAVCNVKNKRCAIAKIMDRGPNNALRCRTIDANRALQQYLDLRGTDPATYKLLSIAGDGQPCTTGTLAGGLDGKIGPAPTTVTYGPKTDTYDRTAPMPPPTSLYPGLGAYSSLGAKSGYPQGLGTGYGANPGGQPFGQPSALSNALLGSQSPFSVSPTPQPVPPQGGIAGSFSPSGLSAGRLMVQPEKVVPGGKVLVSWTSVNMQPSSCRVLSNDTEIASASAGSEKVSVSEPTTFTLACTDAKGNQFESNATVVMQ